MSCGRTFSVQSQCPLCKPVVLAGSLATVTARQARVRTLPSEPPGLTLFLLLLLLGLTQVTLLLTTLAFLSYGREIIISGRVKDYEKGKQAER